MNLYRYGAIARRVSKFVVALVVGLALAGTWGCDGSEGTAGFNGVTLLSISASTLPDGKVGDAYTTPIFASGGSESGYSWSIIAGDLPTGLTLSTTSVPGTLSTTISGTPLISGTFLVTIRVQDARGETASAQFSLTVTPSSLSIKLPHPPSSNLVDGDPDKPYTETLEAVGGTGQLYKWYIQPGGQLPLGIVILRDGLTAEPTKTTISGVPTNVPALPFTYVFTVRVEDSGGFSASQQFSIHVNGELQITTPDPLPDACVGNPYGYQPQPPVQVPPLPPVPPSPIITATGGTLTGYTWSTIPSVPLPAAVTIDPAGIPGTLTTTFTGAPSVNSPTPFLFTVQVTDSSGNVATKDFHVLVHPAINVTPGAVPEAVVGSAMTPLYFVATGGPVGPPAPTFAYTMSGPVPNGVNLDSDGRFWGTPTEDGTFIFNVIATTQAPWPAFKGTVQVTFTVVKVLTITTLVLDPMNQGASFYQQIYADGGTPGYYSWQVINAGVGPLPAGTTLQSSGWPYTVLGGQPSVRGPYSFTLEVTDAKNRTATRLFTGVVDWAPGTIETYLHPLGDGRVAAGTQGNNHLNACAVNLPESTCVDPNGNMYFCDSNNYRIRRVDAQTGIVTTIAGTGSASTSDSPIGINASFNLPYGICIDTNVSHLGAPCLYVTEVNGHRIRRIDLTQGNNYAVTTVAGTTSQGYNAEGPGNIGPGSPATTRWLSNPRGIAIDDNGVVYFCDTGNHRIRRLIADSATTMSIETIAGSRYNSNQSYAGFGQDTTQGATYLAVDSARPTSQLSVLYNPFSIAVHPSGSFALITDINNYRVRRLHINNDPGFNNYTITSVAGTGNTAPAQWVAGDENKTAITCNLHILRGIALDSVNNEYYIAEQGYNGATLSHRIRKISGGTVTTLVGNGGYGLAGDDGPRTAASVKVGLLEGLTFFQNGGNRYLYFTQYHNGTLPYHAIRRVVLNSDTLERVAGWGLPSVLRNGALNPSGPGLQQSKVVADGAGNLYIADTGNFRVLKYNPTADLLTCIVGNGEQTPSPSMPAQAIGPSLYLPSDIALSPNPLEINQADKAALFLYVADFGNRQIRKVDLTLNQMVNVAGKIDTNPPYNNPGTGGETAVETEIGYPISLTFDQNFRMFIGCYGASVHWRVRMVDTAGKIFTFVSLTGLQGNAGDGQTATNATIGAIWGMCADANYLYICDATYHRVRRVNLGGSGNMEHFAGQTNGNATNGSTIPLGDGAGIAACSFSSPRDVKIDAVGNVYVAETVQTINSHRIRKMSIQTGLASTVAGNGTAGYNAAHDGNAATAATLNYPTGIFITANGGSLWICDSANQRLRRVVKP